MFDVKVIEVFGGELEYRHYQSPTNATARTAAWLGDYYPTG
jgi:hypothetical protein